MSGFSSACTSGISPNKPWDVPQKSKNMPNIPIRNIPHIVRSIRFMEKGFEVFFVLVVALFCALILNLFCPQLNLYLQFQLIYLHAYRAKLKVYSVRCL